MMKYLWIGAALAAVFAAPADARRAAAYAAGMEIKSANGSACVDFAGDQYPGVLQYGGLTAAVDTLRVTLPSSGLIGTEVLTITSGIGTTQPGGTFTWKGVKPSGTAFSVSGTFTATITPVDNDSYIFAMNEQYGNCTESSNIAATSLRPR